MKDKSNDTPPPQPQMVGKDYWQKDIAVRLVERAASARQEDTGTAIADAVHFDQAAVEIDRLRELVRRAQAIISTSIYPNWHEAARVALAAEVRADD